MKKLYIAILGFLFFGITNAQIVTTLAGSYTAKGTTDGTGSTARFTCPYGVVSDGNGNLFIADQGANEIRQLVIATGVVTTLAGNPTAGSANGIGTAASFNGPTGLATDGAGNLFVADAGNNEIRMIVISTGAVSTFAGTTTAGFVNNIGTTASFSTPVGICYDGKGNLYIADQINFAIRKIVIATGVVSTLAGGTFGAVNGIGTAASFDQPKGVAADTSGNLYIADNGSNQIRKIVIATATVSTFAGSLNKFSGSTNGVGTAASFTTPIAVTLDGKGNLFVADDQNQMIRKIVIATALVSTYDGILASGPEDGLPTAARFNFPSGVASDAQGNIYVADSYNYEVRKISPMTPPIAYFKTSDTIICPNTVVQYTDTSHFAPTSWRWTFQNGNPSTSTLQNPTVTFLSGGTYSVKLVAINAGGSDSLTKSGYITVRQGPIVNITGINPVCTGAIDILTASTPGNMPFTYKWNTGGTNDTITLSPIIPSGNSIVTTLAGTTTYGTTDGIGYTAGFGHPAGLACDTSGNLYVADQYNNCIRKIILATGAVTTIAGRAGTTGLINDTGTAAAFNLPAAVAVDNKGNLYIADENNNQIRKMVLATGAVTTLAGSTTQGSVNGTGTAARFYYPEGVALDGNGNLYVADNGNNEIRKIVIATGVVTTFAGSTTQGSADGIGTSASFYAVTGVSSDGNGNLYVADAGNNKIRKIVISTGAVSTVAGSGSVGSSNGIGTAASFNEAFSTVTDASGNLYVCDVSNNEIRKIVLETGAVTTLAGSLTYGSVNGAGSSATFNLPQGIAIDGNGNLLIAEQKNNDIRKITLPNAYSVAVTDTNGCSTIKNTSIQVIATPPAPTISSGFVCKGGTLNLGTTSLEATSYSWSGPNGFTSALQNPSISSVTLNANGIYSVTATNICGASPMMTLSIKIDTAVPAPPLLGSNSPICPGTTLKLTAKLSDTANYNWTGPNGFISAQQNPTILNATIPDSGTYSATAINGCGSSSAVLLPVIVDTTKTAAPIISSNSPICPGGTLNLSASDSIATNYRWQGPNYFYTTGLSASLFGVNVGNSGTYSVTAISNCGISKTGTINISIYPPPVITVAGSTSICGGASDTLIANVIGAGPYSYIWNNGTIHDTVIIPPASSGEVIVSTIAAGYFSQPFGVVSDNKGNLYVADRDDNQIEQITLSTGIITTLAGSTTPGSADGVGTAARFYYPNGITIDGNGNLYVSDWSNNRVRKVVISTGMVTTIAGGANGSTNGVGSAASFSGPYGVAIDGKGNLYVSDVSNHEIRKIVLATGLVSSFAGSPLSNASNDGTGTAAGFAYPWGITIDQNGNMYVADGGNNLVRKIVLATAVVTTIAGSPGVVGHADGIGPAASFDGLNGIASDGTNVFIGDYANNEIRKLVLATRQVTTIAGTTSIGAMDGIGSVARFYYPEGVALDANGNLYVADADNNEIREVYPNDYLVTVIDSNGCRDSVSTNINEISALPLITISAPSSICSGNSVILTASGGTSYTWSPSASLNTSTGSSVIATPTTTTNYIITSTNACGSDTAGTTINVSSANGFDLTGNLQVCIDTPSFNNASIQACIFNNRCKSVNGTLKLVLDTAFHITNTISDSATHVSGDTLIWHYDSLFDIGTAHCVNLTGTVSNIPKGDSVFASMFITPTVGDSNPANNSVTYWVKAFPYNCVGIPFDPNEKNVYPVGDIADTQNLTYTIHFQNTGTAIAQNVVVIDTLSPNLDPTTLKVLSSSYEMTTQVVSGNIMKFVFDGINLPDTGSSKTSSIGVFSYSIKPITSIKPGAHIYNTAGIYFDVNPVVLTNTTLNSIKTATSVQNIAAPDNMACFPNPFTSSTSIVFNTSGQHNLELYDATGRKLKVITCVGTEYELQRGNLAAGVYFLKSFSTHSSYIAVSKLVIQ